MRFRKSFIPYGGYWSTPFCKWQGGLSTFNAIELAAQAGRKALAERDIPVRDLDGITLGMTVIQKYSLYGGPWFAAMLGAEAVTGTMVSLAACAER